jgi:hypothetical protein
MVDVQGWTDEDNRMMQTREYQLMMAKLDQDILDVMNLLEEEQPFSLGDSVLVTFSDDFVKKHDVYPLGRMSKNGEVYEFHAAPVVDPKEEKRVFDLHPANYIEEFERYARGEAADFSGMGKYEFPRDRRGKGGSVHHYELPLLKDIFQKYGEVQLVNPSMGTLWRVQDYQFTTYFTDKAGNLRRTCEQKCMKARLNLNEVPYMGKVLYLGSNGKNIQVPEGVKWFALTPNPFAKVFPFDNHVIQRFETGVGMSYVRNDWTAKAELEMFPMWYRFSPPDLDRHCKQASEFFFLETTEELWKPQHYANGPFAITCKSHIVSNRATLLSDSFLRERLTESGELVVTWYGVEAERYSRDVISDTQYSFLPYQYVPRRQLDGEVESMTVYAYSPDITEHRKLNPFPFGGVRVVKAQKQVQMQQMRQLQLEVACCLTQIDCPADIGWKVRGYMSLPVQKWSVDVAQLPFRCVITETLNDLATFTPMVLNSLFGDNQTLPTRYENATHDFSQQDRVMTFVSGIREEQRQEPEDILKFRYHLAHVNERGKLDRLKGMFVELRRKYQGDAYLNLEVDLASQNADGHEPYLDVPMMTRGIDELADMALFRHGRTDAEIAIACGVSHRVVRSTLQGRTDVVYWRGKWSLALFFKERVPWGERWVDLQKSREKLLLEKKLQLKGLPYPWQVWRLRQFFHEQGIFSYRMLRSEGLLEIYRC